MERETVGSRGRERDITSPTIREAAASPIRKAAGKCLLFFLTS